MNDRTKYPRGSPKDILVRMRRMEREIQQMLIEVSSINDNNPNFADTPMDTGRYVVRLKKLRGVIADIKAVIASGEPKLPSGILDPILDGHDESDCKIAFHNRMIELGFHPATAALTQPTESERG